MEGWIIDLQILNNKAIVWFRTVKGNVLRIIKEYKPWLYTPRKSLEYSIFNNDMIHVESIKKKIFPNNRGKFLKLTFSDLKLYKIAKEKLKNVYDSDLLHSQKFLFKENLIPLAKYNYYKGELKLIDHRHNVKPPNLSYMFLSVNVYNGKIKGFSYIFDDIKDNVKGSEEYVLRELAYITQKVNPDIFLVNGNNDFLKLLVSRVRIYYEYYTLGRSKVNVRKLKDYRRIVSGRLVFPFHSFMSMGIAGLEEHCRFSMLPPNIAFRWTAGRLVDSRQCYVAYRKGYVIPPSENLNLIIRTAWEIHLYDKGGVLQTPIVGLHENVAVLDFESMFPNIIVKYNVSYETVRRDKVVKRPRGLLVGVVEPFLKRRLYFKHLKKNADEPYRSWADQRQNELKLLLVSCYGYSGNNFNRFGNPLTFEWINRISRITMSKVYKIVRLEGFKIIYSDTDSIFVKREDASKEDFEKLACRISKATKLPIKVDKIYKFLVLLPSKNNNIRGVGKRYYGRLLDGSLDYKGIELNRHYTPEYIKETQLKLIKTLLKGENTEDVYRNIDTCRKIIKEAIEELRTGRVPAEKLVLRKTLRKKEYRVLVPHYIAARQLILNKYTQENIIEFIYINNRHKNPMRRVQAWQLYDGRSYDRQKYIKLLLYSSKTILSFFSNL